MNLPASEGCKGGSNTYLLPQILSLNIDYLDFHKTTMQQVWWWFSDDFGSMLLRSMIKTTRKIHQYFTQYQLLEVL